MNPLDAPAIGVNRADIGYDVILLIGQSNMSGRGAAFDLTHYDPVDPRIYQYGDSGSYAGVISMAVEPLSMHDIPTGMGPGLVFARWYLQYAPPNRRVLLVPCAHGGTSFGHDQGLTWMVGDSSVPNLFENAISQTQAALAAGGINSRVVAALWIQGETSGDNAVTGSVYQTDLDLLISSLRSRLSLPNLPFILGQMVPEYLSTGTRAQINAVHIDTPRRFTYCGFSYGAVAQNNGDGNHYNAPGQRLNGAAMFRAYQMSLVNVMGVAPAAPTAVTPTQSGTTVNVSWTRPICRITDYKVEYNTGSGWTTLTRAQSLDAVATLSGMTLGATVQVRVSTLNETATSAPSAISTVTLVNLPAQITGLTTAVATQATISLSWNADSVSTQCQVQFKKSSDSTWTLGPLVTSTSTSVTMAFQNTSYDFEVAGVNLAGTGTYSAPSTITTGLFVATLDDLTAHAWAAYSVRKLSNSFAGSAIRVRRSSDGVEQDIGFAAGTLDLDTATLLTFIGSSSGYVKTMYDQSGNGRDVTQTTAALQPRIVNAGVLDVVGSNSKPGPVYDGANSYLTRVGAGLYAAGSATIAGVLKSATAAIGLNKYVVSESSTSSATPQYAIVRTDGTNGSNNSPFVRNDSTQLLDAAGGTAPALYNAVLNQFTDIDSGSVISEYVNGAAAGAPTYTRASTMTVTNLSIGALLRTTVSAWFAGQIPEIIAFASAIGSTDQTTLQNHQKSYFGTP